MEDSLDVYRHNLSCQSPLSQNTIPHSPWGVCVFVNLGELFLLVVVLVICGTED